MSEVSFNVLSLSIPLFANNILDAWQSFSSAEIGGSMAWQNFLTMFDASNIETFTYNLGIPLISVIITLGIFRLKLYSVFSG